MQLQERAGNVEHKANMRASHQTFLALLGATGALALFPDCANGPLKNETICDTSACMKPVERLLSCSLTCLSTARQSEITCRPLYA